MINGKGFTLIELTVTLAVVSILAAIALPSYSAYVYRSRIPVGLDALSAYQTRMEQGNQDVGNYGNTEGLTGIPTVNNFALTCTLTGSGQGITVIATGSGSVTGVSYSVNQDRGSSILCQQPSLRRQLGNQC